MGEDKLDLLGHAFDAIGQEAVRLSGGDPNGIFLYVEIGDGWVGPSLFKDKGKHILYVDVDPEDVGIDQLLMKTWRMEQANKRWTAMHYTVEHGRFSAEFDYDDLEGSDEDIEDRRERILHDRYGDKPVIYPPMPQDSWTLRPPS